MENNKTIGMFYRITDAGHAKIFKNDGIVTRIDADVYPIGSNLSARYEHAQGVILTIADARRIGIRREFEK